MNFKSTIIILILCVVGNIAQSQISTEQQYIVCTSDILSKKTESDCHKMFKSQLAEKFTDYTEVISNNPAYQKVLIENKMMAEFSKLQTSYTYSRIDKKSNIGSGTYTFAYRALITTKPSEAEPAKEKLVLFYSHYKLLDKNKFIEKIAESLDNYQVVLKEKILSESFQTQYGSGQYKSMITVTPISIYQYEIRSLYPDKKPIKTEALYSFSRDIKENYYFKESTHTFFDKERRITETRDGFYNNDGLPNNFEIRTKYNVENKPIHISMVHKHTQCELGVDIEKQEAFINYLVPPAKVLAEIPKVKMLEDIEQAIALNPLAGKYESLKQFLINFKSLPNIIMENDGKGNLYFTGTTNKENLPEGWGVVWSKDNDKMYFGEFKNGYPNGIGFRNEIYLPSTDLLPTTDRRDTVENKAMYSFGFHASNLLVYGAYGSVGKTKYKSAFYRVTYGNFSSGMLNGKGVEMEYYTGLDGAGSLRYGNFEGGLSNGEGLYSLLSETKEGEFENNTFMSGKTTRNKIDLIPGSVVLFEGKKYVIMKKDVARNKVLLDDGRTISSTADFNPTGEYSFRKNPTCQVCGGSGFFTENWSNTYAGTTSTSKTYSTGPTGYIVWEKTTTTTTAPVTVNSSRTKKCSCTPYSNEPQPINMR